MILKHYNRPMVHDNLDRLEPYIINMPLARQYQKYNNWHVGIVDRTGQMDHFLNIIPDTKVPLRIPSYRKTFQGISLARAKELIDTGQELHVFWSGGLDSTTVLAALSMISSSDQIIVYMTHDSLYESGNLYDTAIRHHFPKCRIVSTPMITVWKEIGNGYIVFGAHGGYVMGLVPEHITRDMLDIPIVDHLDPGALAFYEPFLTNFPKPIHTVRDFYYAYFFNFNWNANSYLFYNTIPNAAQRWVSFFNTMEYQNLFVSGGECDHDKGSMRKLIRTAFGPKSDDYVKYKKTRPSYTRSFGNWLFIAENDQIVTLNDIGA